MRAAGGGVEHLAVNGIVSLSGFKAFGGASGAFTGTAQVQEEQQDRCCREDQPQRLARRAMGEEPADHRWPRFQSSIRAWMATAMPISATAMNTQRRVSR